MKDLGKTIAKYRKEHKKNQSDIAKMLENYDIYVKQNTISAWESGTSQPSARQLLALCEILEIYDVYTDFIGKNPLNPLRNLNEEGINKVMDLRLGDYRLADIIPLHVLRERKVFYTTVSAGTGSFLDGEDYKMVSSPDIPAEATFGVHISGDSMEPLYLDGQIIWIHKQETLEEGEIGVFFLDGDAYVKKYHQSDSGIQLISLNKKYAPIQVTSGSTLKTFGKVVG